MRRLEAVAARIIKRCTEVGEAEGSPMQKGDPLWNLRREAAVEHMHDLLDRVPETPVVPEVDEVA